MTNINCSEKCIYQKDGKCTFENICLKSVAANQICSYFVPNSLNKETTKQDKDMKKFIGKSFTFF